MGRHCHGDWAVSTHVDGWCDEIYLGSRRLDLTCTKRVSLSSLNYTFLNEFPNDFCSGKPGHIETWASDNGIDVVAKDYSGFQETIACLIPPTNLVGTGYITIPGLIRLRRRQRRPLTTGCPSGSCQ